MSAVKGVNRTKMDAATPDDRLTGGEFDGRVKVSIDNYVASSLAIGSTIDLGGTLPTGAKILEITLMTDALGSGVTLEVGDDEDPNRYITSIAANTANLVTRLNAIDGLHYIVVMTTASTPDNQVVITTAGGIATGDIKIQIKYTND